MKITQIADSAKLSAQWNATRIKKAKEMGAMMEREKGLVNLMQATVLLGMKRADILKLIERKKLKKFRFWGRTFLSFNEIAARRAKKPRG